MNWNRLPVRAIFFSLASSIRYGSRVFDDIARSDYCKCTLGMMFDPEERGKLEITTGAEHDPRSDSSQKQATRDYVCAGRSCLLPECVQIVQRSGRQLGCHRRNCQERSRHKSSRHTRDIEGGFVVLQGNLRIQFREQIL